MKFGPVPVKSAEGFILAHSLVLQSGRRIRKGFVLDVEAIAEIDDSGIDEVIVAQPSTTDVLEDEAAKQIADKITGAHLRRDVARTGRVNFFAQKDGLFQVSRAIIDQINAIDPAITIATLEENTEVNQGRIVATIKIIPYAVSNASHEKVLKLDLPNAFNIRPYKAKRIGLISTQLPALKPSIYKKTVRNLQARLALSNSEIVDEQTVPHNVDAVAQAIANIEDKCDLVVLFGASAISDIEDIIPKAIVSAGGQVIRFGMPVDPGNLLLLAEIGDTPVIGAPGCARSIAENGFDWVLQRVLAEIPLNDINLAGMGLGGLLMETGARPHSRVQATQSEGKLAAIILAAGQSRRMGTQNKMTVEIRGKPMLRHVSEAVASSEIDDILMVTGHRPEEAIDVVQGLGIRQAHNFAYEGGLSTSLCAGVSSLTKDTSHALVLLGDMPFISTDMIDALVQAARKHPEQIIMATHDGKRGNPVVWPARFFEELMNIHGDVGAKHIIGANSEFVVEVELGHAASQDFDTLDAIKKLEQ